MKLVKFFLLPLIGVLLMTAAVFADNERPRDPWVFRVNLDDRPRMIGLALNDQLWIAYDAEAGGFYKAWDGDVKFTGPVFDNIHGAQPLSRGAAYVIDSLASSPWRIRRNGKLTPVNAEYKGYVRELNSVTLNFTIHLPEGGRIHISESPEFASSNGRSGLERRFTVRGLPSGIELFLDIPLPAKSEENAVETNGKLEIIADGSAAADNPAAMQKTVRLQLNSNSPTWLRSYYEKPAVVAPGAVEADDDDEEDEIAPMTGSDEQPMDEMALKGKMAIANSDCAACHSIKEPQIGPSYSMIAEKYAGKPKEVSRLAGKIIEGGKGVWGDRPMSPHPWLTVEEASDMVHYILSMASGQSVDRAPGIVADFYDIGAPLAGLPTVVAGQNPNHSQIFPSIAFYSGNPDIGRDVKGSFAGMLDDFVSHVSGYLNIKEKGSYQFRFMVANGGKWYLDDKLISSGQIYEGYYIDEKTLELDAGPHAIRILHYQHLFDKAILLQWRANEDAEYENIPAEYYTHDPRDVKPTSPGLKEVYRTNAPGFGASLEEVHPSFDLFTVRPEGFEPRVGDIDFDDDGTLAICTWDGEVYLLKGVTGSDPSQIKVTKMADGLCEPLGIAAVGGEIYVLQRWELTHLIDKDGDGVADEYRVVADDWKSKANFHEWSFGLPYRDGYFYATLGIAQGRGARNQAADRGKAMRISRSTGEMEFIAHGLREANGLGFGPEGELFTTDNEGTFVPVCKVMHIPLEGYPFYGNFEVLGKVLPDYKETPPVIWLPQNEIGNSPSQPILMEAGPYKGQLIHGEVTHGGIKRDYIEKVKGAYQGAVFRFSQGLEVGINRMEWGPDGALYVAGLGGSQDFGHKGHKFGLQRLTYNGKTTFEMLALRARSNGFEIEFTEPVRIGDGTDPADYLVQQWWYEASEEYGGGKKDLENLPVRSVSVSEDRRKVFLELEGLKENHVVYINLQGPMLSQSSQQLWSNQAWYTLNKIPDTAGVVDARQSVSSDNSLSIAEAGDGWKLLFDGRSAKNWSGPGGSAVPSGWQVADGVLRAGGGAGPLISKQSYTDFELETAWRIEEGSEAGILYHAAANATAKGIEKNSYRMQINDDTGNDDEVINTHLTGANYDMQAPRYRISRASGEFNHSRIVVRGPSVEHWLNGIIVVKYTIGSPEWKAQLGQSIYDGNSEYAKMKSGLIALDCFRGTIEFKNIRVRELAGE